MNPSSDAIDRGWAKDVAVAIAVGLIVGWSPITTANRLAVAIVGGSAAAVALFVYRRFVWRHPRADDPIRSSAPAEPLDGVGRSGPSPLWIGASLACALVIVWPAWKILLPLYRESVWQNGHGLLVPVAMIGVWRAIRIRKGVPIDRPSIAAIPILLAGLGLALVDVVIGSLYVAVVGWSLIATGFVLGLFGARTLRTYWPVCAMILFFLPLSASLGSPLRLPTASAATAAELLSLIGLPTNRIGSLVFLPKETFGVSLRCSGFSALYAGAALAFAMTAASGTWRRLAWMLVALWPITILANGLRCAALLAFCHWQNVSSSHTPMHGFSGLVAFWAVVGAVVLLAPPSARRALFAAS